MQTIKAKGQSVRKIEWKQTDGQTDGRMEAIALPPVLTRLVKMLSVETRLNDAVQDLQYELSCRLGDVDCHRAICVTKLHSVLRVSCAWQEHQKLIEENHKKDDMIRRQADEIKHLRAQIDLLRSQSQHVSDLMGQGFNYYD